MSVVIVRESRQQLLSTQGHSAQGRPHARTPWWPCASWVPPHPRVSQLLSTTQLSTLRPGTRPCTPQGRQRHPAVRHLGDARLAFVLFALGALWGSAPCPRAPSAPWRSASCPCAPSAQRTLEKCFLPLSSSVGGGFCSVMSSTFMGGNLAKGA